MKTSVIVLNALGVISSVNAAACKKDTCYNNVANNAPSRPNLNSRKADCASILRTVQDTDYTVTVVSTITGVPATSTKAVTGTTTVVSTTTEYVPGNQGRRLAREDGEDVSLLEERDKIVIKGQKPAYATSCKSNQDYGKISGQNESQQRVLTISAAVACLCLGVKGAVQKTITQLTTILSTKISTTTSTTSTETTKISTSTLYQPTSCSSDEDAGCVCGCDCAIHVASNSAVCTNDYGCPPSACETDADCIGYYGSSDWACAWDYLGSCAPARKACVETQSAASCGGSPRVRVRRGLEEVFNLAMARPLSRKRALAAQLAC